MTIRNALNVAPGTSGQVLTSTGTTTAPTLQDSVLSLISSQTAATSASIIFTSLATNKNYLLVIDGLRPSTDTDVLNMFTSTDNGSTYASSGYISGINVNAYNLNVIANTNSTVKILLSGPQSNGESSDGTINLFSATSGDPLFITGNMSYRDTTLGVRATGNIVAVSATTAVNAIKFQMSSGNISIGRFTLYSYRTV